MGKRKRPKAVKKANSAQPKGLKWISVYCYVVAVVWLYAGTIGQFWYPQNQWFFIIYYSLNIVSGLYYGAYVLGYIIGPAISVFPFLFAFSLLYFFIGRQLLSHKSWSRRAIIALSGFNLFLFLIFFLNFFDAGITELTEAILIRAINPSLGLILSAFILYYMFTPTVKSFFAKN